jgi:hypothetical protein
MTGRRGLLLVLSHMRSYSTLLTHLLSEHESISGWRELHRSYATANDIQTVIDDLCTTPKHLLACDNILHNEYAVSPEVLAASDQVRCIISIRNAYPTLQSLWRWGGPGNKFREPGVAADYYCDRLAELEHMGELLDGRFVLLRSDRLVNHPSQTTKELSGYLALQPELPSSYTPRPDTGDPKYGDFSRFIGAGTIVKDRAHRIKAPINDADYRRCRRIRGEVLNRLREFDPAVI